MNDNYIKIGLKEIKTKKIFRDKNVNKHAYNIGDNKITK